MSPNARLDAITLQSPYSSRYDYLKRLTAFFNRARLGSTVLSRVIEELFASYYNTTTALWYSGEIRFLKAYLALLERPIVIDVGANRGDYIAATLRANPRAKIVAYEVAPWLWPILKTRFLHWPNVTVVEGGLDECDRVFCLPYTENDAMIKIYDISPGAQGPVTRTFNAGRSLRECVTEHGAIDLVKLDVEGYEYIILRALHDSDLLRFIKVVQFEFSIYSLHRRHLLDDFHMLFEQTHVIARLYQNGLEPTSRGDNSITQFLPGTYVAITKENRNLFNLLKAF